MKIILMIGMMSLVGIATAQTGGTISGKVYNEDSTELQPFSIIRMEVAGETISTKSDVNGKYTFFAINPGKYNLTVETAYGKTIINGVRVQSDYITQANIYLNEGITGDEVIVLWSPPKIDINTRMTMSLDEIKHNPNIQSPIDMIAGKSSEITKTADNKLIIRGSRAGDVIYYVDGVKQTSMQSIPGVAIGGMTVYTGGVPAQYGDTTGGVVILETKSYFDLYYAWMARK
tara:strand:+ start:171 stop:863 length:693 start_codon:yes stop_codon:yes gene_type:complete